MTIAKNKVKWLIVFAFFILLIGVGGLLLLKDSHECGVLKINGSDVAQENVLIRSTYAELPLTQVMKNLDVKVEWINKTSAQITYEDKEYTLNLSEVSLVEVGATINLLLPPPGGNRYYKVLEKELVLDSNTIKSTLYQMGIKINVYIDRKDQIVCVTKTGNQGGQSGDGSVIDNG